MIVDQNTLEFEFLHLSVCSDAYCDLSAPLFHATPLLPEMPGPFCEVQTWWSELCTISLDRTGAVIYQTTKSHIQDFANVVVLERYISGGERGISGDEADTCRPGPIYLNVNEVPFQTVAEASEVEVIYMDRSYIGFDPDQHPTHMAIGRETGLEKLVHVSMDGIFAALDREHNRLPLSALEEFTACLKVLLGTPVKREDVRIHARNALYKLICKYIEENLHSPALSTASILSNFGVSRPTLYRMFEISGGVRNYITERRALRALLDISNARGARGIIARSAERWGFSSSPNFVRTITRLYNETPGRLIAPRPQKFRQFKKDSLDVLNMYSQAIV
ncbi:MAG: AraC family transcriptional regulator [Pseudomonadota bacterium]